MNVPNTPGHHLRFIKQTIELARQSPPRPTNFRVGCVIVAYEEGKEPQVLSTGYTLELPGNTHAEQCALSKFATSHSVSEDELTVLLRPELNTVLYTSLEPCGKRLSGNLPCVRRILATRRQGESGGVRKVVFGAKEPGTFVKDSQSCKLLDEGGVEWEYLPEFEAEILAVAMEGHKQDSSPKDPTTSKPEQTDSGPATANAQASSNGGLQDRGNVLRNPKKRMMEAPPGGEETAS